jgi:hypothetical protein
MTSIRGTCRSRTGPARTGSLYWTKSGWRARLRVDVDGVTVQKSFDLGTRDRQVARIKLRLLAKRQTEPAGDASEPTHSARPETFQEAAERVVDESSITTKKARLDRLRRHVFSAFGDKLVTEVVAGDVREVLSELASAGASKETCLKIRNDVSSVLGELWRADMLTENVTAKVRIPKHARSDRRERAVLGDDELIRYLAWQHPHEAKQGAVLERQTMACVSRMFARRRPVPSCSRCRRCCAPSSETGGSGRAGRRRASFSRSGAGTGRGSRRRAGARPRRSVATSPEPSGSSARRRPRTSEATVGLTFATGGRRFGR